MVFGMELGEERCRSEHGEVLTARRTNSSCTPAAMAKDATNTRRTSACMTCGTMLVGAGVPLPSVRDSLGRSSLTVTNIYVDGRPEWDGKSADIMGDVLDAPS